MRSAIENLPAFIAVGTFYLACGAGTLRYLWSCRTPIVASVRSLHIPEPDTEAVWTLSSSGGDVGVV